MYMMAMLYLEMFDSRLLRIILYLLEGSALLAFVLQLMGLVAFHRSLYWFHLLLPSGG